MRQGGTPASRRLGHAEPVGRAAQVAHELGPQRLDPAAAWLLPDGLGGAAPPVGRRPAAIAGCREPATRGGRGYRGEDGHAMW